jgi:hypothetical protein
MPALSTGDAIVFANMGSYITSMARHFCKIPMPSESLLRSDTTLDLAIITEELRHLEASPCSRADSLQIAAAGIRT